LQFSNYSVWAYNYKLSKMLALCLFFRCSSYACNLGCASLVADELPPSSQR
jgi:hypothetical protein